MPRLSRKRRLKKGVVYWVLSLVPLFWPIASWLVWRVGQSWMEHRMAVAADQGAVAPGSPLSHKFMLLTVAIPVILCLFGLWHVVSRMVWIGLARLHQPEKYPQGLLAEGAWWVCCIGVAANLILTLVYVSFFATNFTR